jgi:hypothetical protein
MGGGGSGRTVRGGRLPLYTTAAAGLAATESMYTTYMEQQESGAGKNGAPEVASLQELHST